MPQTPSSQSPLVVFVVEDEVLIQDLLVDPLKDAGFEVLVASTGGEAIEIRKASKRSPS
jgi:DNA-binding response OmpR family regulator